MLRLLRRTSSSDPTDADPPLFAQLRDTFASVAESPRRVSAGRHVAIVAHGEVVLTCDPTVDLLERTLVALRNW